TFNLFVGDLNVNVDDETLRNAFKDFPSYLSGHVMWDMQTGSSRGYGFVSFTSQDDAQNAMDSMQGQDLNGRPLRINWAAKLEH
uniref:Nuclear and cytoplasmic polyadenylated RNA-binding protein PUB1 n=1 Tax=Saccharomyces cerevisiae TaxID=4932 RepID=UPI0001D19314|nr:Chain A, Nuclear and cytoplasmic polyadenylated RNA-binding protein PUB1 [Saccharomyces cerevisiae]3MD1_B Chain B, Nuclear and cytoplasmic polyadenylated RNA-binding protein PUB1 [Saccharomyces cerevisiae]